MQIWGYSCSRHLLQEKGIWKRQVHKDWLGNLFLPIGFTPGFIDPKTFRVHNDWLGNLFLPMGFTPGFTDPKPSPAGIWYPLPMTAYIINDFPRNDILPRGQYNLLQW